MTTESDQALIELEAFYDEKFSNRYSASDLGFQEEMARPVPQPACVPHWYTPRDRGNYNRSGRGNYHGNRQGPYSDNRRGRDHYGNRGGRMEHRDYRDRRGGYQNCNRY